VKFESHLRLQDARKLRVCVVTETYPPEVNGVAATIAVMVRGLRARGHQVEIVRPHQPSDASDQSSENQLLVTGLPIPGYASLKFGMPSTGRMLRRWKDQRPDVVQVVTEGPLGWSAVRAARKLAIPCAGEFHTNFHSYASYYRIAWLNRPIARYLRSLHNATAITMVPTQEMGDALSEQGFNRVTVVSRGVDTTRFHPSRRSETLRASWGAKADTPVVLHVSRLAAEKNLDALFRAFECMRRVQPAARLVVVGDGPERKRYERAYPHCIFSGMRRGDDLAQHYAAADLFLYPSMTETFGNVLIEAMASGLAVLAYDYAAAREHIRHDLNGLVAPFAAEDKLIAEACAVIGDLPRIKRLGRAARATAETVDWERVIDALEHTLAMVARGDPLPLMSPALVTSP
jgi:glycosyltransferase involved in cell wall biosynthesis